MRSRNWMLLLVFVAVAIVGCGGSVQSNVNPTPPDGEIQTAEDVGEANNDNSVDTAEPAAAVSVFLDALRKGDDEKILEMYTVQARQQATELNDHFAPKGSDTAEFEVGEVEYLAEDGARVACTWTDLDQDGQPQAIELLWMVRREPEGWRVAGMAATVFEGEPPVVLDFENLDETIRKVNLLAQEVRRRAEMETHQAQKSENSADSVRR